jgi:hypothetical protein
MGVFHYLHGRVVDTVDSDRHSVDGELDGRVNAFTYREAGSGNWIEKASRLVFSGEGDGGEATDVSCSKIGTIPVTARRGNCSGRVVTVTSPVTSRERRLEIKGI